MKEIERIKERIERAAEGAVFVSETDSAISFFCAHGIKGRGRKEILDAIGKKGKRNVKETGFEKFFENIIDFSASLPDSRSKNAALSASQTEEERINNIRLKKLHDVLKQELSDLTVYRIGKIEIDIYVVGFDKEGNLLGVRMKAIET